MEKYLKIEKYLEDQKKLEEKLKATKCACLLHSLEGYSNLLQKFSYILRNSPTLIWTMFKKYLNNKGGAPSLINKNRASLMTPFSLLVLDIGNSFNHH